MQRLRIWDLPTRIFHWLLAAAVGAEVVTGKIGGNLIDWHGRIGLFILGLIVFRIVWGFIGSSTARFANFVRGPKAIAAYLRGAWRGVGHNPLGALAVLALLGLTAAQVGTGLFANDDIAFQGPLADLVGKDWSDSLRAWHSLVFDGLLAVVGLHLAAIAFYVRVKRENLLRPMLTGWKEIHLEAAPAEHHHHWGRRLAALVAATAIATTTVYAAAGGLLPEPPAAAPVQGAAPAW